MHKLQLTGKFHLILKFYFLAFCISIAKETSKPKCNLMFILFLLLRDQYKRDIDIYIFSKECNVLPCINPSHVKSTLFNISVYVYVTKICNPYSQLVMFPYHHLLQFLYSKNGKMFWHWTADLVSEYLTVGFLNEKLY